MPPSAEKSIQEYSADLNPLPPAVPASFVWGWFAVAFVVGLVILAFTPFTNNLDDIKVTLLHVGGGALLCLFAWFWWRNEWVGPPRWILWPLLGWIASMIFTALLHKGGLLPRANPYQWIGWITIGQHFALLGIFLVHAAVLRTWVQVERALKFWVGILFIQCAFGVIHRAGGMQALYSFLYFSDPPRTLFASLLYTFSNTDDMLGTILNRQFFGDLLGMWAPLALAGMMIWKDLPKRIFSLVALVLSAPCCYLTFSKASLPFYAFGLGVALIAILLFTPYKKINIPHLPTIAGGIFILAATLLFFTWHEFESRFKTVSSSLDSRTIIWAGGMDIFRAHPILGAGPGSFRVLFPEFRDPNYHLTQISNVTLSAHNRVVDLLSEGGIVGTLLYLGFLGMAFWHGIRVVRTASDPRLKVVSIAVMSGLAAFWGASLFHPGIRWTIGATPYWAMLGMLCGLARAEEPLPEPPSSPKARVKKTFHDLLSPSQRVTRLAVLAGTVLIFLNPLHLFEGEDEGGDAEDGTVLIFLNPLHLLRPCLFSNAGYGIRYFMGSKENNNGLIRMAMYDNVPPPDVALQAIEDFRRAVRWNPTFVTSYYKSAHAQNVLRDFEGAYGSYQELMRWAPDYSEVHYNLGVINLMLAEKYRKLSEIEPSPEAKKERLAQARQYMEESLEQYDRAAKMCNKISIHYSYGSAYDNKTKLYPDDEAVRKESWLRAGDILLHVGDLPLTVATQEANQGDEEKKYQENAKRLAPYYYELAGEHAKAAGAYFRVYQEDPGVVDYLRRTVSAYRAAGQADKAIAALHEVLEERPLQFEARNLLAELLATDGKVRDEQAALHQSRILEQFEKTFPDSIPEGVKRENERRLKRLGA